MLEGCLQFQLPNETNLRKTLKLYMERSLSTGLRQTKKEKKSCPGSLFLSTIWIFCLNNHIMKLCEFCFTLLKLPWAYFPMLCCTHLVHNINIKFKCPIKEGLLILRDQFPKIKQIWTPVVLQTHCQTHCWGHIAPRSSWNVCVNRINLRIVTSPKCSSHASLCCT